jgi:hypothetical protein
VTADLRRLKTSPGAATYTAPGASRLVQGRFATAAR